MPGALLFDLAGALIDSEPRSHGIDSTAERMRERGVTMEAASVT